MYKNILLILTIIFISTTTIQAQGKSYTRNVIANTAKAKLGHKYKWGGNGPYRYDCSGFTKEVFKRNGIKIPRNSWNQAKMGMKVSKRYLKKGDLVFFNSRYHKGVNHVGIYLGKGKFIHASRFHKRIVISKLKEYKQYFKWGCRLT
jgi:cell wall-associated NlpC family hydrolase